VPEGWVDPPGEVSFSCQPSGGQVERVILHYFGNRWPGTVTFRLSEGREFRADILDTWEITITRRRHLLWLRYHCPPNQDVSGGVADEDLIRRII